MTLGKRGRPEMKRTTSMTEFTMAFNCGTEDVHQRSDPHDPFNGGVDQRYSASSATAASPRPQRRSSADLVQTAHFLRVCSLCKRRLIPGRDIYMYRGDRAFCSLECRQQQMTQDETKEKCSLASKKESATTAGECFAAV